MADEQRGSEDLWKQAFPVGTEILQPRFSPEYNWSFSNLDDAFKEGGVLHGKDRVFVFSCTQLEALRFFGRAKPTYIPVVVVIVSPFPPSDKFGIISRQTGSEEIVDMNNVDMAWVPYIPPGEWASSLETPLPQISIISRVQREAVSEYSDLDLGSQYFIPYFENPYKVDVEEEQNTAVNIVYSAEAGPIVFKFDWEFLTPELFTEMLIDGGKLSRDEKDAFKGFVKEKVKEGKRANREAIRKQIEALEESRRTEEEKVAAFENMRFYKFYPVATPDTPDLSRAKSRFINDYYGKAHQVF